jgi:hypothetical protein
MSNTSSSAHRSHSPRSSSRLKRKIRHIGESKRKQRQITQMLILIVCVLIAFYLGFFYFGPSFNAD